MPFDEWATVSSTEGRKEWDSAVRTLRAQLQRAIDNDDPDVNSALQTAGELRNHWWRCQEFGRPDDGDNWNHSEDRLIRQIGWLGEAITRQSRDSRRSAFSRLLRAPLDVMRPSAETCRTSAVYHLDHLDVIIQECVEQWGYDERNRLVHQEQIDRGLRPAHDQYSTQTTRLPRHDAIDYQKLGNDVAEGVTMSAKASLNQLGIPDTGPKIPPPSTEYPTFAPPTSTSHMINNSTSVG